MYFFKVSPARRLRTDRYYNGEMDTGFIVRDSTILMAPNGYHTVVSAPGYTTYYLWSLARRTTGAGYRGRSGARLGGRTVPMLKALGHSRPGGGHDP